MIQMAFVNLKSFRVIVCDIRDFDLKILSISMFFTVLRVMKKDALEAQKAKI